MQHRYFLQYLLVIVLQSNYNLENIYLYDHHGILTMDSLDSFFPSVPIGHHSW